jgi:hypothetical protein
MPALSGTGTSGDEPGTRGPSDVSVGERTLPAKETSDAFLLEELRALGRADGVAALSRLSGGTLADVWLNHLRGRHPGNRQDRHRRAARPVRGRGRRARRAARHRAPGHPAGPGRDRAAAAAGGPVSPAAGSPSSTPPSRGPGPKSTCPCCGAPRVPQPPPGSSRSTRNSTPPRPAGPAACPSCTCANT